MGDEGKKESEGVKSGADALAAKLDSLIASIARMDQRMETFEKESGEMKAKLAKEETKVTSEEVKDNTEERQVAVTQVAAAGNVRDNSDNSNLERDSQNANNDPLTYKLIHPGSATVGTLELDIIRGLGTRKGVIDFKDAQEHLSKFRRSVESRYSKYKRQIEESEDADEIKDLMEIVDSEQTKKLGNLMESAWFDLEQAAEEMVKLTQNENEQQEIMEWAKEEQIRQCNMARKDRVTVRKMLSEKLCQLNIHEKSDKDLGERADLIVPELPENANLEESDE